MLIALPSSKTKKISGKIKVVLLIAACMIIIVTRNLHYSSNQTYLKSTSQYYEVSIKSSSVSPIIDSKYESQEFQLILDHCKIPKVPFISRTLQKLWQTSTIPKCSQSDKVSTLNVEDQVELNELRYKDCCYREITRPVDSDGFITSRCTPFTKNFKKMYEEFFVTECSTIDNKERKSNFHATIPLIKKNSVMDKIKFWDLKFPDYKERPPSILMLALDATSRAHAYRSLPKTMNLLLKLNFIDFKGHHILGEPTLPNALPLLLGVPSAGEFWKKDKTKWKTPWDKYPFIWKDFDYLHYVTFYTEDLQRWGTYQYGNQQGFTHQPTDYYLRPFLMCHERSVTNAHKPHCFGNETIAEFILDYQLKLLTKTKQIPSFSLTWLSWPQHDDFEALPVLDDPLLKFFTSLAAEPSIFDNTIIIFFSDHGSWNTAYSDTHEGLIERRLPLLFILYPKKLMEKYPEYQQNLKDNSYRITSHHDTYQTLIDLSKMAARSTQQNELRSQPAEFRYSLLEKIPDTRSCHDAQIPVYACACNLPSLLGANDKREAELRLPSPIRNAMPLPI